MKPVGIPIEIIRALAREKFQMHFQKKWDFLTDAEEGEEAVKYIQGIRLGNKCICEKKITTVESEELQGHRPADPGSLY